jgi:lysophospholipase
MMELTAIPGNPIPGNGRVSTVELADGICLRVARWRPTVKRMNGTVLLIQGRAEFIEKYFETIADLRRRGFCVVTFDLRGQGRSMRMLSDPRKGHVDSFEEYVRDIEAVLSQVMPSMPRPHFGMAHSMGAASLLLALEAGEQRLDRAMLLSPLAGLARVRSPLAAEALAYTLDFVALGGRYVPGGGPVSPSTKPFEGNRLTSDPVRYGRVASIIAAAPDLAIGDPTIRWALSMFQTFRRFAHRDFGRAIQVPTLILIPGADPLCDSRASEELSTRIRGCMSIIIPGARHELLLERDVYRSQVFAAMDAFLPGELSVSAEHAAVKESIHAA